jgi:hypothetical protein
VNCILIGPKQVKKSLRSACSLHILLQKRTATDLSCQYLDICREQSVSCLRLVPCAIADADISRGLNTTVELREKSNELSSRIFDLEQALRASHALMSTTRHPLLADHLLALKEPFIGPISSPGTPIPVESTTSDRHGTLAVYPDGRTQYYGPSASSWVSQASIVTWS